MNKKMNEIFENKIINMNEEIVYLGGFKQCLLIDIY